MTTLKFLVSTAGDHTHCRVFAGKDVEHLGKCGNLVFRNEEWTALSRVLAEAGGMTVNVVVQKDALPRERGAKKESA